MTGRTTAGVVRIGNTVRRPIGPHAALVHRLLRDLENQRIAAVPRFLGIDDDGREILSFLSGSVPDELGDFSATQRVAAARLLRSFHDATAQSDLREGCEVVCHGDASPCNYVFREGVPIGLIDFDAAHPGRRRDDVGYAAWLWLDIGNEDLLADSQGRRLAEFVLAYGALDVADAIAALLDAQTSLAERQGASHGTRCWAQSCRDWVLKNFESLSSALQLAGSASTTSFDHTNR